MSAYDDWLSAPYDDAADCCEESDCDCAEQAAIARSEALLDEEGR